ENETEARNNESLGKQAKKLHKVSKQKEAERQNSRTRHHGKGEMELTFNPKKAEKVKFRADKFDESDEETEQKSGRTKQRFAGRRSAGRNQFRGM
ncbi:hypothetical protein OXX80_013827, partial [Metschnikowia pulcherrima]